MIYELAGILAVNPDCFTLNELFKMVKGKGRYDWQHTSGQMALLINMFSEGKKVHPKDLNPYEPKTPGITVPLEFLKDIFVNRKK